MHAQIYGKENKFDAARLIDLLGAYETFAVASQSARGSMDVQHLMLSDQAGSAGAPLERSARIASLSNSTHGEYRPLPSSWPRVRIGDSM